jgi:putative tryptophan/tyrosine transport system substrate-binding protein
MRRRDFIAGLGGAAAWPLAARAQQPTMLVIGLLCSVSFESYADRFAAFRGGLRETGFVEGRNVAIEYRSADGHSERLETLAADLVRQQVTVIFATGGDALTRAAKAATANIPIVFAAGGDVVKYGLATTLNRPESNVTGVSFLNTTLGPKRLELLGEVLPVRTPIAILANADNFPSIESFEVEAEKISAVARGAGRDLSFFHAGTDERINQAFAGMAERRVGGLLVDPDAFLISRRERIVALAAHHMIPIMYATRDYIPTGGLMSYGPKIGELYREAGVYVGRILKGAKPADLPILLPTRFELVINLKTAKTLGLTIPETLLATADEVIQ